MVRARLTELEATVLGELSICQPCTAYVIRRSFAKSPTPTWSASAGTIYPALERLVRRGLVRAQPSSTGKRRSHMLTLTAAGRRRLEQWLEEPLGPDVLGPPMDALRTRVGFLAALPAAAQRRFLERAIEGMRAELARAKKYVEEEPDENSWERLVTAGLFEVQRVRAALLQRGLALAKRGGGGVRRASHGGRSNGGAPRGARSSPTAGGPRALSRARSAAPPATRRPGSRARRGRA